MKAIVSTALIAIFIVAVGSFVGLGFWTNPSVPAGEVGYVTNEPLMFGEKGEFLGMVIGPSSYGIGWCNRIKYSQTYKPWTVKEYYSPIGGAGQNKKTDTRILSKDQINMELSVSVVLYLKNSPATKDFDATKFKVNTKNYFENYANFWNDRYREPFRTKIRNMLGTEDYKSVKDKRVQLGKTAMEKLETWFEGTPIGVLSVNISNINPPQRMQAEQELLKATEIAKIRQAEEAKLQAAKKSVLEQEARNLQNALSFAPKLLEWKDLAIKEMYARSFNNLVTGDEAKSIGKVIFMPYGTPVAAPVGDKVISSIKPKPVEGEGKK